MDQSLGDMLQEDEDWRELEETLTQTPGIRREYIKLIPKYFFIGLSIKLTLIYQAILRFILWGRIK